MYIQRKTQIVLPPNWVYSIYMCNYSTIYTEDDADRALIKLGIQVYVCVIILLMYIHRKWQIVLSPIGVYRYIYLSHMGTHFSQLGVQTHLSLCIYIPTGYLGMFFCTYIQMVVPFKCVNRYVYFSHLVMYFSQLTVFTGILIYIYIA